MRATFPILLLLLIVHGACRTADRSGASVRFPDGDAPLKAGERERTYQVNKSFADGEFLELPVDPSREIEAIEFRYVGGTANGATTKAYLMGVDGVEREIDAKNPSRGGGLLVLRFKVPLVRKLPLESVRVRYK